MTELDALRAEVVALRQHQQAADQERQHMIAQITNLASRAPGPDMAAVLQGLQDPVN